MVIILCRFCKSSKSLRHREFPGGLPSKYYSGPTMLDFRNRTRTGVFIEVWSQTLFCCWFAGVMLYAILRFICQTGLILCKKGIILNSHKKLMRGATVVLGLKRQQKVSSFQKCHQIAAIFQPFRSCRLLQAYMRVSEIKTIGNILCRFVRAAKAYDTGGSQAVPHPSTIPARRCLTSVIGRERVCSSWYGRRHCFGVGLPVLCYMQFSASFVRPG